MAIAKYNGIDNTVKIFLERSADSPYWALWQGKEMHDQYTGDDLDESIEQLKAQLTDIKNSGNNAVLVLHPHTNKLPKGMLKYPFKDDKNFPVIYPIYFSVFEKNQGLGYIGSMPGQTVYANFPNLDDRLNRIESSINALISKETEPEPDDDEEPEDDMSGIGQINEILNSPAVQTIIGLLTNNNKQPQVHSLGALDENWEKYIQILFQKGLTVEHLKKLSEMPEKKIHTLLNML